MEKCSEALSGLEWPAADLEHLGQCPACDSDRRTQLFTSLRDSVFEVAPGVWNMWRCEECAVVYLDPRPNEQSIGRAYTHYYTQNALDDSHCASVFTNLTFKTRLRLGYFNSRYGYSFAGGLGIGRMVAAMMASADHKIRHLSAPSVPRAALLDVGCGNGAFLQVAQSLGFDPIGLEPDDHSAANARAAGLDVRSGVLPRSRLPVNYFEHVTLNHVFEHLHRPRQAASEILRILKPGGRAWFSQPNAEASGLKLFGKNWRGLEVPRHLSLYGVRNFTNILRNAGFEQIELLPPLPDTNFYFRQSLAIHYKNDVGAEARPPGWDPSVIPSGWNWSWRKRARDADKAARRNPLTAESFTMIAFKPL
jgi:SAM-dependent methyltransferase